MRAVLVTRFGGPDVLTLTDVPPPQPDPQAAVVDIAVAGVNFLDVARRRGEYPQPLPFIPGVEAVGRLRDGARVAVAMVPGTYAEQVSAPVDRLIPVPDDVDDETAAAIVLQGLTAHVLVTDVFEVRRGQVVAVRAAAGGVGSLLVQLAAAAGATVLGVASSPDKRELAQRLGATPLDPAVDLAAQVRELTGGRGADVFFESAGATGWADSLGCLAPRGVLVGYGQSGGPWSPVDSRRLADAGSLTLVRPRLNDYLGTRDALDRHAAAVFAAVRAGRLRPQVSLVVGLGEVAEAHEQIESRRSTGKLLVRT